MRTTSRSEVDQLLRQPFRVLAIDDQLRALHGRADANANRLRDALLDQRVIALQG